MKRWLFVSGIILIFGLIHIVSFGAESNNKKVGILILAHGSSQEWNHAIRRAIHDARGDFLKEIVFGMGDNESIQAGIDNLEKQGVKAIIVVPLFLSSKSEMYRNIEYILGLREEPDILFWMLMGGGNLDEHSGHQMNLTQPVRFSVPYEVRSPINYDPLISMILIERVREAVRGKNNVSVLILAHGPISTEDNKEWLFDLNKYNINLTENFPDIIFFSFTFRDDAPPFIKDSAVKKIQDAIRREKEAGREVVIIPYLLASGGRENEINKIAKNCGCEIYLKPLLPHPNISLWIEQEIKMGLSILNSR